MDDLDAIRQILSVLEPFSPTDKQRILRWVSEKVGFPGVGQPSPEPSTDPEFANPERALRNALAHGNYDAVKALLPRFVETGATFLQLAAATPLAAAGDPAARDALRRVLDRPDLSTEHRRRALGSLVQYYLVRDEEASAVHEVEPLLVRAASEATSSADKAFFLNQLGRLYWGADRYADAARVQEQASRLAPDEAAYHFNLSVVYERLGRLQDAAEQIRYILRDGSADPDHLAHAVEVFSALGLQDEASVAYERLLRTAPERARTLAATTSSVRRVLSSKAGKE